MANAAPPRDPEREFWLEYRRGLLIQISAIEKRYGMRQTCPDPAALPAELEQRLIDAVHDGLLKKLRVNQTLSLR